MVGAGKSTELSRHPRTNVSLNRPFQEPILSHSSAILYLNNPYMIGKNSHVTCSTNQSEYKAKIPIRHGLLASFSSFLSFQQLKMKLLIAGLEPGSSGVGSDRSSNLVITTAKNSQC